MSKKAVVSTADLRRMAIVAKSENVTIEVEIEGVIVRVKPYDASAERGPSNALPNDFAF